MIQKLFRLSRGGDGERGIRFGVARSQGLFQTMLKQTGLLDEIGAGNSFVSIRSAIASWHPDFK
jgi:hypothetical protein